MVTAFAHEGHDHSAANSDAVVSTFVSSVYGQIFINLAPFVLLALLIVIMQRVFKLPRNLQLACILVYLLFVGLLGYQIMPAASIVSLVAGFGLSLALVILPFKRLKK